MGMAMLGHRNLKFTVSQKWIDVMNWLHAGANSMIFGWMWSKNECDHLVHETLKSTECVYELS